MNGVNHTYLQLGSPGNDSRAKQRRAQQNAGSCGPKAVLLHRSPRVVFPAGCRVVVLAWLGVSGDPWLSGVPCE